MSQYFPEPYEPFSGAIHVKVDFSNYETKTGLKNVSHFDVNSFALKPNLASLKTEINKIDADKLKTVPIDLAKLSNVVKNDVVKKTENNKLVTKVDNIDAKNFVKKTKYEKDGSDFENKISKINKKKPDVTNVVKKTDFNTKVTEIEGKLPDVSSLVTKSALPVFENKIPDVSSLVKKTDFNTRVTDIEGKIPDVSNLVKKTDYTTEITNIKNDYVINAALNAKHKDLVQKTTFKSELKKVDDKVSENSSKLLSYEHKLKQRKDTINDLEKVDSYFRGKNYFDSDDGTQSYLVFQLI